MNWKRFILFLCAPGRASGKRVKVPKRPGRRLELIKHGIEPERAKVSTDNGFGPWRNASTSHMKQAFSKRFFDIPGLIRFSE